MCSVSLLQQEPQGSQRPSFWGLHSNEDSMQISLCYPVGFFQASIIIVLLQSMGKVLAWREEQSLPAANTRAPAHVIVCWLCCRGTWADGWMHMGRRREGEKLKSDVTKEILMKVKRSSGEGEPGLRNSVRSPMPCTFLDKSIWGKGFLEVGDFDKQCWNPMSLSCENIFSSC